MFGTVFLVTLVAFGNSVQGILALLSMRSLAANGFIPPLCITLGMAEKIFKSGNGRTSYPSDISDEEWEFCAPYLTLMKEEAPQREHSLRVVFNAMRYMVRAGCPWRMIPNDLAPWSIAFCAGAALDCRRMF